MKKVLTSKEKVMVKLFLEDKISVDLLMSENKEYSEWLRETMVPTMSAVDIATEMIKVNEGFRTKAYLDVKGILTIGYGLNLERGGLSVLTVNRLKKDGITKEEATEWLRGDIETVVKSIPNYKNIREIYTDLDVNRQAVIIDMCYNMGTYGVSKFPSMLRNIGLQDWEGAGLELLDSNYARTVGNRAKFNANVLETGENKYNSKTINEAVVEVILKDNPDLTLNN